MFEIRIIIDYINSFKFFFNRKYLIGKNQKSKILIRDMNMIILINIMIFIWKVCI